MAKGSGVALVVVVSSLEPRRCVCNCQEEAAGGVGCCAYQNGS